MRCEHCNVENDVGAAVCENCGTPLTAYGGQITGEVSAATRLKAARLAGRPVVVPIMGALDILLALVGPFWTVAARIMGRTAVNSEGTNYLGAAFGAVGIAFLAMVLVPIGIALVVIAWGTLTQRSWAWTANLAVLIAIAVAGGYFLPLGSAGLVIRVLAAVALGVMWFRTETREWFGA